MIKEVEAKSILQRAKHPESWFGVRYNYNLYRGCTHSCIYCDSRSECYGIDNFDDVIVKVNAPKLLVEQLSRKRLKGTIGTGSMSDPYEPIESKYLLTRQMLEVIARYRYPLHLVTKSDMVVRDIDILLTINQVFAQVVFTITTTDEKLASIIEPGAPSPTQRLKAMKLLSEAGINVGVLMMPILPFLQDNTENIIDIVDQSYAHGASFIIPSFGVTLRGRQREYFYQKLDEYFPNVSAKYQHYCGNKYSCGSPDYYQLKQAFNQACRKYQLVSKMSDVIHYEKLQQKQLKLF